MQQNTHILYGIPINQRKISQHINMETSNVVFGPRNKLKKMSKNKKFFTFKIDSWLLSVSQLSTYSSPLSTSWSPFVHIVYLKKVKPFRSYRFKGKQKSGKKTIQKKIKKIKSLNNYQLVQTGSSIIEPKYSDRGMNRIKNLKNIKH